MEFTIEQLALIAILNRSGGHAVVSSGEMKSASMCGPIRTKTVNGFTVLYLDVSRPDQGDEA